MPSTPTDPGVYVAEMSSGVRPIPTIETTITAFVGRTRRGAPNTPVLIHDFAQFERLFGGLWQPSTLSYAVSHYFANGGTSALIVRLFNGDIFDNAATLTLPTAGGGNLVLAAASPGEWGNFLRATIDHDMPDESDGLAFNLTIEEIGEAGGASVVAAERFDRVSVDPANTRFIDKILAEESSLVRVRASAPANQRPDEGVISILAAAGSVIPPNSGGGDGGPIVDADVVPAGHSAAASQEGLYALERADIFNLLCIPPLDHTRDLNTATLAAAARYCRKRRAIFIIDPPERWTADPGQAVSEAVQGMESLQAAVGIDAAAHTAVYFPRLQIPDPLCDNQVKAFAPCGAVAGIIARMDRERGLWKAPAGPGAAFTGVDALGYPLTGNQNDILTRAGLNCLRTFPTTGHVIWGARTLAGADRLSSEWKYLPVRRLALHIEESLSRGIRWAVFEANDEYLWSHIRLSAGDFMQDLFRQGAFQGARPRDAYIVKCGHETTTESDIHQGFVNLLVGFAPLRPAEFVIIKIRQAAGRLRE